VLTARGKAFANLGDFDAARGQFERALAIAPGDAEANASLATLLAHAGDTAAARSHAERALAAAPAHIAGAMALASVEIREGGFASAEGRLRALLQASGLDAHTRARATGLLGDALDGQQRAPAAFLAYTAANEALVRLFAPDYAAETRAYLANLKRLTRAFETTPVAPWLTASEASAEDGAGATGHAFLVGFPRSGTTLLEQVLAAHPRVVTLEEQPTLAEAEAEFLEDAGGVERLAVIDAETAQRLRRGYWQTVQRAGVRPEGKLFIDKLPLNAPNLPLIAKLFPQARILFARRDPRDVVLSCFRRAFLPNRATYAMLTLKGAAELYAAVMALAAVYRARLPIEVHEVRYERFVEDFEGEARAFLAFLGLEWDDAMRSFASRADGRLVNTPSAAQVRRGVYRGGEGQWRPYRSQMAPVLPILAPWIEPQGYPPE
jgi:tetratricopeptide (TPR) repeat protein